MYIIPVSAHLLQQVEVQRQMLSGMVNGPWHDNIRSLAFLMLKNRLDMFNAHLVLDLRSQLMVLHAMADEPLFYTKVCHLKMVQACTYC